MIILPAAGQTTGKRINIPSSVNINMRLCGSEKKIICKT